MRVKQGNQYTKELSLKRAVKLMFSVLGELTNDGYYPLAWFDKPSLKIVIHPMANEEVRAEIQKYTTQHIERVTIEKLINKLLEEWIGQKIISESEIKNLKLAALDYLYISRESMKDTNLIKEIEETYLENITEKEAIIASNILSDLIRKGIAKDPKGGN